MWCHWINSYGFRDFIYKDCGAGGNCQMLSIAECILPLHTYNDVQIRQLMASKAKEISFKELKEDILPHYLDEVESGVFRGNWNPKLLRSSNELGDAIAAPIFTRNGYDFQGDGLTLRLIAQALEINIFVFDSDNNYFWSVLDENLYDHTIFLLFYKNAKHYQALGVRRGEYIQTIFTKHNLPIEFSHLLKQRKTTKDNSHTPITSTSTSFPRNNPFPQHPCLNFQTYF